MSAPPRPFVVQRLAWEDEALGSIPLPARPLKLRSGFGSGLTRRAGDPEGHFWAVGDRGPNLKVADAIALYGLDRLQPLADLNGAKIMPRPDLGPAIALMNIAGDRVEMVRTIRLGAADGRPLSGLPGETSDHLAVEPVFDLEGRRLPPDPNGLDTEGIAALRDGRFWIGDEFGPSLACFGADGRMLAKLGPGSGSPALPAIAAKRQLNRGFEALTLSGDEKWLFLAFQSPLAHPDEDAHRRARHVRIWRLHADTGAFAAQYLYPLDPPETFRRDTMRGRFGRDDVKIGELAWLGGDSAGEGLLLVLERGSETTKIYRTKIAPDRALAPEHLDLKTWPTVEEMSGDDGADFALPVLDKSLLFSSDNAPELVADLEGMTILSPTELLLVNDNDFGVEGTETSFWKLSFETDLATGPEPDPT